MVGQFPEPDAHVLNVRAFRIELEFRRVGFAQTGVLEEKPLGPDKRTNNKLNPPVMPSPGIEPRVRFVGVECSHHCAILWNRVKKWISLR